VRAGRKAYTKPQLDKLGVKPEHKVTVVRVRDPHFVQQLRRRVPHIKRPGGGKDLDLVFLGAETPDELELLDDMEASIARNGAVWVVVPRGVPELKDTVLIAAGKKAGLVDNKICRFSGTHTAMRFVVPKAKR
jgi:hypothetical protein